MRYTKLVDIWAIPREDIAKLQPGQWVYAGNREDKGRYYGIKESGSVVVGWHRNAKTHKNYKEYMKVISNYSKGI